MLAAERGFPEIQALWNTDTKHYVLMRLSEVLIKRTQRIAETKATSCSAIEISRFKKKNHVFVAVSSPSAVMEVL